MEKRLVIEAARVIADFVVDNICNCQGYSFGRVWIESDRLYIQIGANMGSSTFLDEFLSLAKCTESILVVKEVSEKNSTLYLLF